MPDSSQPIDGIPLVAPPVAHWSKSDTLRTAERALKKFRSLGVALPANDRLTRAVTIVEREFPVARTDEALGKPSRHLVEALRTVVELAFIAKHSVARPEVLELISIALGGADIPEQDPVDQTKPRDTQVELLVWAMMRAAKVHARLAEPDVVIRTPFGEYGVAVKRSSGASATKLVDKGVAQVAKHTKRGFIAVAADARMSRSEAEDPFTAFTQEVDADLEGQRDRVARGAGKSALIAVLLVGTSYRWVDAGNALLCAVVAHLHVHPNPSPPIDEASTEAFFKSVATAYVASLASLV